MCGVYRGHVDVLLGMFCPVKELVVLMRKVQLLVCIALLLCIAMRGKPDSTWVRICQVIGDERQR